MSWIEQVHGRYVASRRANVLARCLAHVAPAGASVLDVGCGDGEIASLFQQRRPDASIRGVDVLVRANTRVPVTQFDGRVLPFADGSFDVVSFIDVLHHCDWPLELLSEARRVATSAIVIKDHLLQGFAAQPTLRFMDGVGNRRYGVALPFNYWRRDQWSDAFASLGLSVDYWDDRLGLYAWPLSLAFDRRLHFLARLAVPSAVDRSQSNPPVLAMA